MLLVQRVLQAILVQQDLPVLVDQQGQQDQLDLPVQLVHLLQSAKLVSLSLCSVVCKIGV